jgi:hypothetical protein
MNSPPIAKGDCSDGGKHNNPYDNRRAADEEVPYYGLNRYRTKYGDRKKRPVEALIIKRAAAAITTTRNKDNQRAVIIGAGFFLALIASLLTAMSTEYSKSLISRISSKTTPGAINSEPYRGQIVRETMEGKRCRRIMFDNRTGRVTEFNEMNQPCEELANAVDDTGWPKPVGTISRLDAISKSFANR